MAEYFIDKDLGEIRIKRNIRAKRSIARRKPGIIELTVPAYFSDAQVLKVLEEMKPRLSKLEAKPELIFSPDTVFETLTFSLRIENRDVRHYHTSLSDGVLHIICPGIKDFADSSVQNTLRNSIENAMRSEAKRVFPPKLESLARIHRFDYTALTINKSKTRWGSCSSRRSINLSYFCLQLPEYLLDFVILHELCHTVEMNHGERFWMLLDKVSGGNARKYTHELKKHTSRW